MSTISQSETSRPASGAFGLFLAINLTALSLAIIGAGKAQEFGVFASSAQPVSLTVFLTACIALPLSALAAQHRMDIDRLTAAFLARTPIDQLTGLLDRRFFEMVIQDELKRMDRSGRPSAIALLEVDQFEALKQRYGTGFGNAVLRQVSVTAHTELRGPFDKVSRWTDDSFIVLMNDVSIAQAEHICDRLRETLSKQSIHHKGQSAFVTTSLGVSSFAPAADTDAVLAQAQSGLDTAQAYGGNKVCNNRY